MNKIKINKKILLKAVTANRNHHQKIVFEALKGYRTIVLEALEQRRQAVLKHQQIHLRFTHDEPEDHLKEYDRIIKMLEMSSETVIELSGQEFDWYVMDNWHWKDQWIHSNALYSNSARTLMATTTTASSND